MVEVLFIFAISASFAVMFADAIQDFIEATMRGDE